MAGGTVSGETAGQTLQDVMGSLMDVAGMAAIAGGTGWGLWPWLGPFALIPAGLILIFLSAIAAGMRNRPDPAPEAKRSAPLPGPAHPGNVHVGG